MELHIRDMLELYEQEEITLNEFLKASIIFVNTFGPLMGIGINPLYEK